MSYERLKGYYSSFRHATLAVALERWERERIDFSPLERLPSRTIEKSPKMGTAPSSKEIASLFELAAGEDLSVFEGLNLKAMKRIFDSKNVLSDELQCELFDASQRVNAIWCTASQGNDWPLYTSALQEFVELNRTCASVLSHHWQSSPFAALLAFVEPAPVLPLVEEVVGEVSLWAPELLRKAQTHCVKSRSELPILSSADRMTFGNLVLKAIGVEECEEAFSLSRSTFSLGLGRKMRLTVAATECHQDSFLKALLHETGHFVYERLAPIELSELAISEPQSSVMHEAIAILFERFLPLHIGFQEFLCRILPGVQLPLFSSGHQLVRDNLLFVVSQAVRTGLERDLLEGRMKANDVPRVWAERFSRYTGIESVPPCRVSFFQPTLSPSGLFGYSVSYLLGVLAAAQIFVQLEREGVLEALSTATSLAELQGWLAESFFTRAHPLDGLGALEGATGHPLSAQCFQAVARKVLSLEGA